MMEQILPTKSKSLKKKSFLRGEYSLTLTTNYPRSSSITKLTNLNSNKVKMISCS